MKITLCLTIGVFLAAGLWAQSSANKGEILGTVFDPNQAVVPGASVKIKNTNTGASRDLTTNDLGQFRAVLLDPGQYDVTVEKPGFASSTFTSVIVNVGSTVDLPVTLRLGTTSQTVEVGASLLPVDMPAPSSVISTLQVQDLPINGRRFQDFALMTPTVQVDPVRGQLSFVGQRGIYANVMVDGADYNQPFFGGIRGGERSNFIPTVPQSSIQEFQVVTDGYTAEYGRSTGGMLNTVTKSGTNTIHGEAFYSLRHKETGLKTPFNKQILETLQQFGGAAGGAIKKDKLFWFGAIERQLSKTPRQILFGTLVGVGSSAANSEALGYLHSLEGPFQSTNDAVALTGRGDYQFTGGSRLTLRYNYSDANAANAASVGGAADTLTTNALSNNGTEKDRTHTGLAQLTNILTPNVFNDLRFSYTYELRPRTSNSSMPTVSMGPIGQFGARNFLPNVEDDKRIQINDSVSLVRGRHNFKFGGDYNYASAGQSFGFNQFGAFSFTISDVPTILKILSGNGSNGGNRFDDPSVQYRRQIGNLLADFHLHQIAFYGQDSWRVSPRFLLNFGLRWEGQVNGQPAANNTAVIQAVQAERFPLGVTLDPTKFPNALNQVMPRFGFTFTPTQSNRTVIRGHAGIFYAGSPMILFAGPENNFRVPAGDLSIAMLGGANTVYKQLLAAGVDLNKFSIDKLPIIDVATVQKAVSVNGAAPDPFRGASFTGLANDFRNPRSIQAGLGLDQEVLKNFVVGVQFNYVNTVHLERNRDYNLAPPSVIDASGRPIFTSPRPLSQYSIFTIRESSARSMYRGTSFSSRYRGGRVQFGAFYTVAQAYSDDDNERDATGFRYENAYNLHQEYGYSNLDARHQFAGNAVVSLPLGMELSGIYRFRSGLPIDPAVGSDVNKDGNNSDRALQAPGKLFPRNSFRNTAFNDFDLRFLKSFKLGERVKLQFSTEMFNLFNFTNIIIAGRNLNYGAGINAQGQAVPANANFRQLRLASGQYDPVNTQVGFPFQAQFGLRLFF